MKNQKLWIGLLLSVLIHAVCWCLLGVPTSLWFRRLTGLAEMFWTIEDLTIYDLKNFLQISKLFLGMSCLFVLAYIISMLWGYLTNIKHFYMLVVIGSLLSAQIITGTLTAFYPQSSGLALYFPTGTEYAPGFKRKAFAEIHAGMGRREVEQRIGRGFEQYRGYPVSYDSSTWYYSQPKEFAENYWKYWIHFNDDRVSQVDVEFWID